MGSNILERTVLSSQERLLSHLGVQFLSMEDIQTLSKNLANKITPNYNPDLIVGIERGGTYPAYCLSKEMQIPYTTVDISRDKNYLAGIETDSFLLLNKLLKKSQKEPTIKKSFKYGGIAKRILIVDDDCGSMKTLDLAKSHLREKGLESKTSVILTTPQGTPDFFADWQLPLSKLIKGSKRFPWIQYSPHFKNYQKWVTNNSKE